MNSPPKVVVFLIFLFTLLATSIPVLAQQEFYDRIKKERIPSSDNVTWTRQGPGNSGMSEMVHYHPLFPDTVFFNPDMGGNYQSDNNGTMWYSVRDYDSAGGFGRLVDMRYSHANPNFAVALEKSHLFISSDRGKSWSMVKNCPWYTGPSATGTDTTSWIAKVSSLEIDPSDADTWYVGAGRTARGKAWNSFVGNGNATYNNPRGKNADVAGKIWKTTNGGRSWTELTNGLDAKAQFSRIAVNPNNSQEVFAASNYGLYRSSNGGRSWTNIGRGKLPNNTIIDLDYYHNGSTFVLYVIDQVRHKPNGKSVSSTGGVFKSVNRGNSWENISGNLNLDLTRLDSGFNGWGGVKTTYYNYIAKWFGISVADARNRYSTLPTSILQPLQMVRADPSQADRIYVGLYDPQGGEISFGPGPLWKTSNGGRSWIMSTRGHGPAFENDGDYWRSRGTPTNENMVFGHEPFKQQWGSNYPMRTMRYFDINSRGDIMMISGHNTMLSTDHGNTWNQVDEDYTKAGNLMGRRNSDLPGEGIFQDHRFAPGELYLASGEHRLWRTTPDGEGQGEEERVAMKLLEKSMETVSSVAIDPDDLDTFFTTSQRQHGKDKIWKTTDGGETFIDHGKVTDAEFFMRTRSLKIDPTNKQLMYFGVSERTNKDVRKQGGFYFSNDGGRTFTQRNKGLPANVYIHDIEWDPRDPTYKSMFVAAQARSFGLGSIFPSRQGRPSIEGGLYHTNNRGQTWRRIKINSEVHGINDIKIDQTGRIYVTAGYRRWDYIKGGLWHSDNWGNNWQKTFSSDITEYVDVSPFNPDLLVVSVGRIHENPGIYFSDDRGKTWTKNNKRLAIQGAIQAVEFSIHDPEVLWLAELGAGFSKGTYHNQTSCKYDFGTADSPVQEGWQGINPETQMTNLRWGKRPDSVDRDYGKYENNLMSDFVYSSSPATLHHKLENGRWYVTLKFGDAGWAHDGIVVKAEGAVAARNINVAKGRVAVANFAVDVRDGELDLEFSDAGGDDRNWVVNSMVLTKNGASTQKFANGLCVNTGSSQPMPRVPGKVEAEDYVRFFDSSAGNYGKSYRNDDVDIQPTLDVGGGYSVGWTANGEWLEYDINVTETSNYRFDARVASSPGGGSIGLVVDGRAVVNNIAVNATGGWQKWQTISAEIGRLSRGIHTIRVAMPKGNFNINWLEFSKILTPIPTSAPIVDQCDTTAQCKVKFGNRATDCLNSYSNRSICMCGASACQ